MNKTTIFIIGLLNLIWVSTSTANSPSFTSYPEDISNGNWIIKNVNPGKNYYEKLIVKNLENETIQLNLKFNEFIENNKNIQLLENQKYLNIGNWISPTSQTIQLLPYETKRISFEIKIPKQTLEKQYQGAFLISKQLSQNNSFNINTRIGNRIYLNVTNNNLLENNIFNLPISKTNLLFIFISILMLGYSLFHSKRLIKNKNYER